MRVLDFATLLLGYIHKGTLSPMLVFSATTHRKTHTHTHTHTHKHKHTHIPSGGFRVVGEMESVFDSVRKRAGVYACT